MISSFLVGPKFALSDRTVTVEYSDIRPLCHDDASMISSPRKQGGDDDKCDDILDLHENIAAAPSTGTCDCTAQRRGIVVVKCRSNGVIDGISADPETRPVSLCVVHTPASPGELQTLTSDVMAAVTGMATYDDIVIFAYGSYGIIRVFNRVSCVEMARIPLTHRNYAKATTKMGFPCGICVDRSHKTVYVTDVQFGTVFAIDTTSWTHRVFIGCGEVVVHQRGSKFKLKAPIDAALSPCGRYLVVGDCAHAAVFVFRIHDTALLTTFRGPDCTCFESIASVDVCSCGDIIVGMHEPIRTIRIHALDDGIRW